jgi:hypothetical protein
MSNKFCELAKSCISLINGLSAPFKIESTYPLLQLRTGIWGGYIQTKK